MSPQQSIHSEEVRTEPAVTQRKFRKLRLLTLVAARGLARMGPILIGGVLTLVLVTIPRLPLGTNDDSSWSAVLGYAHLKGLQFGADIVFSYGPLGFLITPYLFPENPWLRVGTDLVLTLIVTAGLPGCMA